uniref:non-specific protein-tyrosine kinase n=1 Tax=Plectus sambesii TaxID=2011161 RepID=A0A914VRN7_9BILA
MDDSIIKIHLVNGAVNNVRYNEQTTVQRIIQVLLAQFGGSEVGTACGHYALRLVHLPYGEKSLASDTLWLHRDLTMRQVTNRYLVQHPRNEWKFELRVRYLAKNLEEMSHTDPATFHYFYDQIRADYLTQVAWKVDDAVALELGCIEIRRFFKDMQQSALDRKSNLDFLEQEIGFNKFFPEGLIASTKPKALRKSVQQHFKKYAAFSETECMFRFLDTLGQIARYDIEIFKASLGAGWSVPLEVVIGPDMGICYVTDSRCGPTRLADFMHIVDIQTHLLDPASSHKTTVQLRVSGTPQPLVITCPNLRIAESLADLIDGYQMLTTQQPSVWSKKDFADPTAITQKARHHSEQPQMSPSPKIASRRTPVDTQTSYASVAADDDDNDNFGDYAAPLNRDYHIDRHRVTLEELLGEGQFGDVYRGTYEPSESSGVLAVAVKACKVESEETQASNFLEEAYIMQQFQHPHIIKLVGVCFESPIWIVMELAPFGELRSYLIRNKGVLDLATLLLYCHQLSGALSYLDSRKFVHRDIAARNVLVSTHQCVKLSDFGLSRWIEHESFYTASRGKLPIKWMAPESINFRRFTPASDMWMFGVCIWEIMMRGVKPWHGTRNQDVVHKLEAGERLAMPPAEFCPPQLYALLCQMWTYEPNQRPTIGEVKEVLHEVLVEERNHATDTLQRENRRVKVAVQQRGNSASPAPPKPMRHLYPAPVTSSTVFSSEIPSQEREKTPTPPPAKCGPSGRHVSFSNGVDLSVKNQLFQNQLKYPLSDTKQHGVSSDLPKDLLAALEKQRIQSEEDEKWLATEAQNLLPTSPTELSTPVAMTEEKRNIDVEPPPPADAAAIDRESDPVYAAVLRVVQAITELSKRLPELSNDEFVEMIKNVTSQLKALLVESSSVLSELSPAGQSKVQMVEKLLGSDMQKLADAMRKALEYRETTLDQEYRRQVLICAHVLAVDCKHFFEAIDAARISCALGAQEPSPPNSSRADWLPPPPPIDSS